MKIKIVQIIIAAVISALLAYGFYSLCRTDEYQVLLAIGGFICLFISLSVGFGVRFEKGRASTNVAVLGWVFFSVMLISHVIFAFVKFGIPGYVIVNGILLVAFIGITYAIAKAKQ